MTVKELKQILIDEDVPDMHYRLEGGLPSERHCIGQNAGKWEVYYSERGNKSLLKIFDNESDACDYFYNWLIDGLTKQGSL